MAEIRKNSISKDSTVIANPPVQDAKSSYVFRQYSIPSTIPDDIPPPDAGKIRPLGSSLSLTTAASASKLPPASGGQQSQRGDTSAQTTMASDFLYTRLHKTVTEVFMACRQHVIQRDSLEKTMEKQQIPIKSATIDELQHYDPNSLSLYMLEMVTSLVRRIDELEREASAKKENDRSEYETQLQKMESDIRQHIRVQQQLKLYSESVESKLEDERRLVADADAKLQAKTEQIAELQREMKDKDKEVMDLRCELQKLYQKLNAFTKATASLTSQEPTQQPARLNPSVHQVAPGTAGGMPPPVPTQRSSARSSSNNSGALASARTKESSVLTALAEIIKIQEINRANLKNSIILSRNENNSAVIGGAGECRSDRVALGGVADNGAQQQALQAPVNMKGSQRIKHDRNESGNYAGVGAIRRTDERRSSLDAETLRLLQQNANASRILQPNQSQLAQNSVMLTEGPSMNERVPAKITSNAMKPPLITHLNPQQGSVCLTHR
jgi:hypothetical protein